MVSNDIRFDDIASVDAERAARLSAAPSFEVIVAEVIQGLRRAIERKQFQCAMDYPPYGGKRAIFQFQICPQLYDWFFNSRSGIRAQYRVSPDQGIRATATIMKAATDVVVASLPVEFPVRHVKVDRDLGCLVCERAFFRESLSHEDAKVWVGEWIVTGKQGLLTEVPMYDEPYVLFGDNSSTAPAPYGPIELTWLDLKGAVIGGEQTKDRFERATQIHRTLWT